MTMTMSSFKKAEQEYWKDHFDLKVNFADVVIPQKPNRGSWCLIIMPKGLTMDPTVEVIRKDFEVITHAKSLDKFVPINARITNKNYAVWVYVGAEPNQKYLGKTPRQTDIEGRIGNTLFERLVLGHKHFIKTGKHLDIECATFCTASRTAKGLVPFVYSHPIKKKVGVYWIDADDNFFRKGGLREAVYA